MNMTASISRSIPATTASTIVDIRRPLPSSSLEPRKMILKSEVSRKCWGFKRLSELCPWLKFTFCVNLLKNDWNHPHLHHRRRFRCPAPALRQHPAANFIICLDNLWFPLYCLYLLFILGRVLEIHHERDAERVCRVQTQCGLWAIGVQPKVGCLKILYQFKQVSKWQSSLLYQNQDWKYLHLNKKFTDMWWYCLVSYREISDGLIGGI